jgi:hypothetical protein
MKELEMPKAELIRFESEDIVRTSPEKPCNMEQ